MALIEYAVANADTLRDTLTEHVAALAGTMCPAQAHGQVSRVATRFALVGVAGEIATLAGITGWENGDATAAARTSFASWLSGRGGSGNVENITILQQVSGFLQAHGESRFTWWHRAMDDHKPSTVNRAGFKRLVTKAGMPINSNGDHHRAFGDVPHPNEAEETETEYIVFRDAFEKEICKGFNHKTVAKLLIERGVLEPETGANASVTQSMRLPGMGKSRCYKFKPGIVGVGL